MSPGLDDLDFDTIEMIRPKCNECSTPATYVAYVECIHGFYTFLAYCQRHQELFDGWQNDHRATIQTTFMDAAHQCESARWQFRYFAPSERRYVSR